MEAKRFNTGVFQSKMNYTEDMLNEQLEKCKEYLYKVVYINKWMSIETIPSSIIGEFFHLWNNGDVFNNRKIELNETDEYYRIVEIKH